MQCGGIVYAGDTQAELELVCEQIGIPAFTEAARRAYAKCKNIHMFDSLWFRPQSHPNKSKLTDVWLIVDATDANCAASTITRLEAELAAHKGGEQIMVMAWEEFTTKCLPTL